MNETNQITDYVLEGQILKILTYPHPLLSKKASPVERFDSELATLAKNMLYTMYLAPGIGLAAPQAGESLRLFVLDVDFEREEIEDEQEKSEYKYSQFNPHVFINPKIIEKKGQITYQEGCLSVPGVYEDVDRCSNILLEYQDLSGTVKTMPAEGLLAICIQHEIDHLDGIIFLDRLGSIKGQLLKNKLKKQKKKKK